MNQDEKDCKGLEESGCVESLDDHHKAMREAMISGTSEPFSFSAGEIGGSAFTDETKEDEPTGK